MLSANSLVEPSTEILGDGIDDKLPFTNRLGLFVTGLHHRVNSLNLIGANSSGNAGGNDESRMTAETCPCVPPSTATPETVEMVKLCGQDQHQQSPNNCSDDVFCQQYYYNPEYAKMESWLDEHPDFTHDYFTR